MGYRFIFYAAVFALISIVLVRFYTVTGDTFDYFGFVSPSWVKRRIKSSRKFIRDLKTPKILQMQDKLDEKKKKIS